MTKNMKKKPRRGWRNINIVIAESKKIMIERSLDRIPTSKELCSWGYSGLSSAIVEYHGGFHNFRELAGEDILRNRNGYGKDISYIREEIETIMKKYNLKRVPSRSKLIKLGFSHLSRAISKYHSFKKLRKIFGERQLRTEDRIWRKESYTLDIAKRAIDEFGLGALPSCNYLMKNGYTGLANAIMKYHGGFSKFRIKLGEEDVRVIRGSWKNLDYVLNQAKKIIKRKKCKTLPSPKILIKEGYSSFVGAIMKYHGGMVSFRKLLGETNIRTANGLWKNLEYTLRKSMEIMVEQGWNDLPSYEILQISGYGSLKNAIIRYHSGISSFRKLLDERLCNPSSTSQLSSLLEDYVSGGSL